MLWENKTRTLFRLAYEKLPLFGLTALSSLFTLSAHLKTGTIASFYKFPLKIRIENALLSYIEYIIKMFWPNPLAILYPIRFNSHFGKLVQPCYF